VYAQTNPAEQFARLHFYSMRKLQDGQEIEFTITVKEFVTPKDPALKFFAQADRQTNQEAIPFTPKWGSTLLGALRFPYQRG
jgi:hypothetical protein